MSRSRIEKFRQAEVELHSLLLNPHILEMPEPHRSAALAAFESLLDLLAMLKQAVPFRTRVGILRRSLMPCFQEIFILHQLTLAVIVRLRQRRTACDAPDIELESIPDSDERRRLQLSLSVAMPFWRKEEWNVYDHL